MMRPLGRRTLIAGGALLGLPATARAQLGPGGVVGGQPMPAVPGGGLVGPGGLPGPTLELDFQNGLGLDPRISFTRASSGTYFDVTGTLQTAASNVPRIGYNPVTHAIQGLLIEEARTNLLLNSATLATQSVTGLTATAYTLSFYGTGSVAMSGVFTGTLAGTGAFPTRVTQTFTPAAGALTLTVTGSVLDAQLEAGAFATSYILTTTAAATRAADVATMPVGAWFIAAAGTIAVDGIPTVVTMAGINQEFVSVGTNSSNLIRFVITNGSAQPTVQTWVTTNMGGPTVANSLTNGVAFKGAFTYNAVALTTSVVLNGGAIASATSTAVPAFSSLFIGGGRGGPPDSYFSRVRYWPRALSAGELKIVTT